MTKHVLLIDDDRDEQEDLLEAFKVAGIDCDCSWVSGPEKAYLLLDQVKPDIIFLDLNMPKTNGLSCLHELKKNKKHRHIPVILYSTAITDDIRRKAMEAGALGCIRKGVSAIELAGEISYFLFKVRITT
jgi:PleD family two-component response regulator